MLTTVLIMAVFTPLKNTIQRVVDRYLKEGHAGIGQLADFRTQLESRLFRLDPAAAAERLVAIAESSFGAQGARIELDRESGRAAFVGVREPSEATIAVAAADGSTRASLTLGPRTDGLPYRSSDRNALEQTLQSLVAGLGSS